ncbi:MAG: pyridoxal-phosphate dependent enzyme [Firmicutes bacterium]|nr:pyridoxal-phosphate dependent enzyme [Bacillota bacterium]
MKALVSKAKEAISGYLVRTPLVPCPPLSEVLGFPVHLKLENLQVTGAFKFRGALNRLLTLQRQGVRRVIAASSGSHAMGVALAARMLGLRATVVMPESSPELKRRKVSAYGAEVLVRGRSFDDAALLAARLAGDTGAVLVSGLEDEEVMAGHGTMGLEILEDLPSVDFVAVPVGGGGAIAGLLMALKDRGALKDHGGRSSGVAVWGVQAAGAPSMKASLERGEPVEIERAATLADAIAVRRPGRRALEIVRRLADGVVTVDDEAILRAMGRLALEAKVVAEPASAAPLAVDWSKVLPSRPRAAVFIVTGGNVSPELLRRVLEDTSLYDEEKRA